MNNHYTLTVMTAEETTKAFKSELTSLLKKYNATLSAEDHYQGYPECGEDVRITVDIPSKYKDNECCQEWTEIDLGHRFDGN